MENLTVLYKKLAMLIHPDKGGSTRDMQQLNKAYNIFKHLSKKYLENEKDSNNHNKQYKTFTKQEDHKPFVKKGPIFLKKTVDSSFRFPYPKCDFRVEDTVKVTENGESKDGVIQSITKNAEGMFVFVIDFGTPIKAKLQTYIREDDKASEDPNFYLFKARWEEPIKF